MTNSNFELVGDSFTKTMSGFYTPRIFAQVKISKKIKWFHGGAGVQSGTTA